MDVVWPNSLRELRQRRANEIGKPVYLEDVAIAMERSVGYISRLEKGRQRPDRALLEKLSRFYEVPVSSIEKPGAPVKITSNKIVGAWLRVQRQKRRMSIEALARGLPTPVSSSQIRLIEAGQRSTMQGPVVGHLVDLFGMRSLEELEVAAHQAHRAGELDEALRELHPQLERQDEPPRGLLVGKDEPVELPDYVRTRLAGGEIAYLVPEFSVGATPPLYGAYIITRRGEPLRDGLIFDGGRLRMLINGIVQHSGLPPSREAFNVLAIVPPVD